MSVENVIEGMYLASKNLIAIDKIYIISDWCTIEEFVNHISIALGKEITKKRLSINLLKFIARATSFIPKNYLTVARVDALSNRAIYSTKKIETDLNYKPIVTMKETIEKLVLFYKGRNF